MLCIIIQKLGICSQSFIRQDAIEKPWIISQRQTETLEPLLRNRLPSSLPIIAVGFSKNMLIGFGILKLNQTLLALEE